MIDYNNAWWNPENKMSRSSWTSIFGKSSFRDHIFYCSCFYFFLISTDKSGSDLVAGQSDSPQLSCCCSVKLRLLLTEDAWFCAVRKVTLLLSHNVADASKTVCVLLIINLNGYEAKLRTATICFVICVCPSVRQSVTMERPSSNWTDFH